MFVRLHPEQTVIATSRAVRLGSAAAAFALGLLLLGTKLGLAANYQHELALSAAAVVMPTVEVIAHRALPVAAAPGGRVVR